MPPSNPAAAARASSFSARDDSELYGLLDRIQDVALHLISLNQIGGSSPAT
jgi:hypothetical protein